jgi:hypothetical protein
MNYTIILNSNGVPAGFVQEESGEYTEQQAKDAVLCGKLNPTPQEVEQATVANENQILLDKCKTQAVTLLQETDWTTIPDVANPSDSNPYLTNQREFMTWRSEIRQFAVNPVANPVWPTQPTPQWGNKA